MSGNEVNRAGSSGGDRRGGMKRHTKARLRMSMKARKYNRSLAFKTVSPYIVLPVSFICLSGTYYTIILQDFNNGPDCTGYIIVRNNMVIAVGLV